MTAPLVEIKLKLQREIFREQSFVEPLNTDRWVANNRTQSLPTQSQRDAWPPLLARA
jgi:hypothetical protein